MTTTATATETVTVTNFVPKCSLAAAANGLHKCITSSIAEWQIKELHSLHNVACELIASCMTQGRWQQRQKMTQDGEFGDKSAIRQMKDANPLVKQKAMLQNFQRDSSAFIQDKCKAR